MKKIMFLTAAVAVFFLLLPSCRSQHMLRIVSYNVGSFHKASFCTEHMCEEMLKELDPDAICLQELDSCNRRGGIYTDQLAQFASSLGRWPYMFGSAISYKGGSYGIGTLVHPSYDVVDKWSARLPKVDARENRALSVIETDRFVICCTHLENRSDSARFVQVSVIDSLIAARYTSCSKPVFLCGDMNSTPDSPVIARLKENWELLSSTAVTFSTKSPRKCIDYVFAYKNAAPVKLKEAKVCTKFSKETLNPVLASDHFPIMVEVEY